MKNAPLEPRTQSKLVIKIADSNERRLVLAGRRLVYDSELGHHGIDASDRYGVHFVALLDGEVVGALRLIGPIPLPLEVTQFVCLNRPRGSRTLQVGGLWLRRSFRKVSPLTLRLFGLFTSHMRRWAQRTCSTEVFLRTHVRAVEGLYRAVGFRRLPELDFDHPLWGKVYCMYLPVFGSDQENSSPPGTPNEREIRFTSTLETL